MRAATIKIFLVDGDAEGLRIATKSNWTGEAIVCPRPRFVSVKDRKEFNRPGIYVLVAPDSEHGSPVIYIGEADPVLPRLEKHFRDLDFWTSAIVFTSTAENLTKAHVQYIEAKLVELARQAKRYTIENKNSPQLPSLPESDQADMEVFLEEMRLVYPILGVTAFETPSAAPKPTQLLRIQAKGILATGFEVSAGFVVRKGSQAVRDDQWVKSAHRYGRVLRDSLIEKGVLEKGPDHCTFTQDYTFDSPSSAAQVIQGRTANGRIDWKDAHGITLKEIQGGSE